MSAQTLALAAEAVADKHWRWLPGMLARFGDDRARLDESVFGWDVVVAGWLPDLDDAATLGCLLALVREAWGRDVFVEHHGDGFWRVHQAHREYVIGVGRTESAALVAALLCAP